MFGLSEATIIVSAVGVAATFLLWGALGSVPRVLRTVTRSFRCPFSKRSVTADFDEDAWDRVPLDVTRCTAFTPPTAITCKKLCAAAGKFLR